MTLPAPLTPPDCDLRDFDHMPLMVVQLRDSDMAATPDAEVFRAAVLAWCVAWHQMPAASLPDDDRAIARLIGMGRDVAGFAALRAAGALRGFVKCSDGRLYHSVIAERATIALAAKRAQRHRTEKARAVALSQRQSQTIVTTVTDPVTDTTKTSVTGPAEQAKVREGKGSEGIEKKEAPLAPIVPVTPPIVPAKTKAVIPPWVPAAEWEAFADMRRKCRKPMTDKAIELKVALLGRLKTLGYDPAAVLNQSTGNSWSDLYPIKSEGNRRDGSPASSFGATVARVVDERAEPGFAFEGGEGDVHLAARAAPAITGREGRRLRLAHQP
jgi:hypothetical protein